MTTITSAARATSPGGGDWKESLGRLGLVGKGLLFVAVGILALQLAAGDAGADTSSAGAIEWIASQPLGKFLLVFLTVALFSLAAWRLLDAALGDPVEGSGAGDRLRFATKGLIYLSLAVASFSATVAHWSGSGGSASGSGSGGQQKATATVLQWPGGRWIVAGVGVVVVAYAVYAFVRHAVEQRFLRRMAIGSNSWIATVGRVGYGARSLVYLLVGYFFVQAAISYQPNKAEGLSGALKELAGQSWGRGVLWGVSFGLLAYGVFTLAESRYRHAA